MLLLKMGFSRLLWLTLSLNVCLNKPRKTESEVLILQGGNSTYLQLYRSLIGPQRETRSPCRLRLVKFHCLTHFPSQYRQFGNTYNYFGGFFKSCIKKMAKRNLARTTRKHGRFVEDIMMRYFEHKVCDFSRMVLETNSKTIERLIPMKGDVPQQRQFLLHQMSDSGYLVTWDAVTSKWCTRGKKLGNFQQLVHPLISIPQENHWLSVLRKYLGMEDLTKAVLGFKLNIRQSTTSTEFDLLRCHPNLYPQGELARPWYDFANISFNMGRGVFESYPAKVRLFAETVYPCGKKVVVCVIQQFANNEKSRKTVNKLLPFLQQDKLSNKFRVVKASTMNSILLLPCQFPESCTPDDNRDFVVLPPQSTWDNIGWPDYKSGQKD
jgi:hypothetical protein